MASGGPLGLAQGKVALVESDAEWAALYRAEEQLLRDAIGGLVVDIQHFGSTSIPGIKAKPILDVLVGLPTFDDGPLPASSRWPGSATTTSVPNSFPTIISSARRVERTHLLHAVEHGGYHWTRNLRFRDRMRADPHARRGLRSAQDRARHPLRRQPRRVHGSEEAVHRQHRGRLTLANFANLCYR